MNEQSPVVVGQAPESGLTLLFPDQRTYGNILSDKTKGLFREKDIKLTDDGRTLLLNLKKSNGERHLFSYHLD